MVNTADHRGSRICAVVPETYGRALLANVSMENLPHDPWGLFLRVSTPSSITIPKQVSFEQALRKCFRYKRYIKPTCTIYLPGNEASSSSQQQQLLT
jgi:hypothetical protein